MKKGAQRMDPAKMLKRIEYLMGAAKIGIDIIDSRFNIRYIDPAWAKAYGDPAGQKCYRYFMGKSAACPGCGIVKALKTNKITVTEERLAKEGNRPIEVTTIPFKDENGDWLVAETNVDISRMKQAEDALRQSEERYRALAESASDAIFIVDRKYRFVYMNSYCASTLGMKRSDAIGRHLKDAFPPGVSEAPINNNRKVFRTGKPLFITEKVKTAVGERWHDTRLAPIKDENGKTIYVAGIARDISLLKRAEEVLTRDKKGLEKLVNERSRDLLRSQEELGKAKHLSELGLLAATIAHELRTPLAAIRTAAYNIDNKCTSPAIDTHIENIEKKVLESDHIIRNLLAYSRIKVPMYEDTDPCEILDECIGLSREIFRGYDVIIRKVIECARPCTIQVDPVQLREVFSNVLNNAYECFRGNRGVITIRIRQEGGYFKASFRDNGPGIPADDLKRILEPFFTTKTKGVGLGLPVCRQIIELHGGTLDITSRIGKGTTVLIAVPVRHAGGGDRQ